MIDIESLVLSLENKKAVLVGDSDWGLEELEGLLKTSGGLTEEKIKVSLKKIDPGTYLGKGKLEELSTLITAKNCEILLVDFDLSPSQYKNIQKLLKPLENKDGTQSKILLLDRSGIILEIFNKHARTKEAKLQVDLARLQYLMPRLTGLWSHFERQRGSGGGSLKGKGMGEKQIEVDRRLVKERMAIIRKRLKEVEENRSLQRKHRGSLLKVAIVGYTNAGKSTLLNKLTKSDVLVEDALFATLDATVRLISPKSHPVVLGIDTVGFIDKLPHNLVASFRSTLKEAIEADLLLHVMDASNPEVKRHFEVTLSVLKEIGIEIKNGKEDENKNAKPMLLVFNKIDRAKDIAMVKVLGSGLSREAGGEAPLFISAHEKSHVDKVHVAIDEFFARQMETYEVLIPFEEGKMSAKIHESTQIISEKTMETGMFYKLRAMPEFANQIGLARYKI